MVRLFVSAAFVILGISGTISAQEAQDGYAHGNGALELFDAEGQNNMPAWVNYWLQFMILSFAIGLLFVRKRIEARWAVGGLIVTLVLAQLLTRGLGIAPLSGLFATLHLICWSPALYLLIKNKPFLGEKSLYKYWSGLITGVILFSFIFDIRDAVIYLDHILGFGIFS